MAKARKTYHKENLRHDLLQAGRAYVERNGHQSLSVRTLAQAVGVSPGAPYHHFANRRELLVAIAGEGFRALNLGAAAIDSSTPGSRDKLVALGMHFIEFADKSPRLFELMYEGELSHPRQCPELEQSSELGHRVIRTAIASGLRRCPPRAIEVRTASFWACIYGFAALRRTYDLRHLARFSMSRDAIARSVVEQAATAALAK